MPFGDLKSPENIVSTESGDSAQRRESTDCRKPIAQSPLPICRFLILFGSCHGGLACDLSGGAFFGDLMGQKAYYFLFVKQLYHLDI